jgi:Flp pilus assembly protein TadG
MIRSFLKRLRRDDQGAAIIELALVAPILATMTIGVIDLSSAFGRKLALEQAAHRAIEKIMNTTADDTVEATLQKEAAKQANVPIGSVEVTFRVECDGSETQAADCADGQTMSQWINVEVNDTYTPMFSKTYEWFGGSGAIDLKGEAGIRTQ